jgi:hypothetical protein
MISRLLRTISRYRPLFTVGNVPARGVLDRLAEKCPGEHSGNPFGFRGVPVTVSGPAAVVEAHGSRIERVESTPLTGPAESQIHVPARRNS